MPTDGYELWGGKEIRQGEHSIAVSLKHLPIFLLSGHVVPLHRMSQVTFLHVF